MTRAIRGFEWTLRRREVKEETLPLKQQFLIGFLVMMLLLSAFSVIYLKDLSRRLFIQYQQLQHTQEKKEMEWSKLLLEKGAWSTQARVQHIADTQLNMVVPTANQVVLVENGNQGSGIGDQ